MTLEHERIQELLAGHALRALDGEDALEAERLLAEHVPDCPECLRALEDFSAVAGDLALAAPAAAPPDVLLPRLRREIGIVRSRRSRWAVAAAAAAVVVVGMGAWNTMLNLEVGDLNQQQAEVFDALRFAGEEGVSTINVATAVPRRESLVIIYERNATDVTLAGHNMPVPASGSVYRLWVGRDGDFLLVNEFVPEDGVVLEALEFEAGRWEEVLVTEEPAGQEATRPSGSPRWHAFIRHDEDPDQP